MNRTNASVAAAAMVILALVPLTGAVGPVISVPDAKEFDAANLGTGNASVSPLSIPDTARIDSGQYGAGSLYLRVPEAEVHVESVTGRPMLIYRLDIDGMGYSRSSVLVLDSSKSGRLSVSMGRALLRDDSVPNETYSGTLSLTLRADGGDRRIVNETITVSVTQ